MGVLAIIRDTLRQSIAQVIIFIMLGLALLTIILPPMILKYDNATEKVIRLGDKPGKTPSSEYALLVRGMVVGSLFIVLPIFFIFAASFLTVKSMQKDIVEQYLSKSIARWEIILGKVIGINLVCFIPVAVSIIGLSMVLGNIMQIGIVPFWDILWILSTIGFTLSCLAIGFGTVSRGALLGVLALSILWIGSAFVAGITSNWTNSSAIIESYIPVEAEAEITDNFPEEGATLYFIAKATVFFREYIILPTNDLLLISIHIDKSESYRVRTWRPLWVALAQSALGIGAAFIFFKRRDF